jgi:membrane-associated protease RseP (regulator of RpoE activity)
MRLWPFSRRRIYRSMSAPSEELLGLQDLIRRNLEDVMVVEEQGARGNAFIFGGELRTEPRRALAIVEGRLRAQGYTPFINRENGHTWVQVLPIGDVGESSRPGLNIVLFLLTLLSTLAAGSMVAGSFPWVTFDPVVEPARLLDGLPFALTLLAILGTHEFGHYFTARAHGAAVSLPYFIPAPPPIFLFGTLGAVIRMRSPARDRNSLFDIAAAGPLAGLVVALPALWMGLSWSRVGAVPASGAMAFGDSLLMRLMTWLMFGRIPDGMDVFVHPVALAGWVGLFVTALNLFPVGQLDGGRIAYALFGPQHRKVSLATFVALIALGMVSGSMNWIVFAGLVALLVGFNHGPPLDDVTPLSPGRYAMGVGCLLLLVLLIPPVPFSLS